VTGGVEEPEHPQLRPIVLGLGSGRAHIALGGVPRQWRDLRVTTFQLLQGG
jgi:hypothetical protein